MSIPSLTRRQFFKRSGLAGLGLLGSSSVGGLGQTGSGAVDQALDSALQRLTNPGDLTQTTLNDRAQAAFQVRVAAAQMELNQPNVNHANNNDEAFYPNKIGSFHKTLPHNQLGEVDLNAYATLVGALTSGKNSEFEAIPQGGPVKLANPQAAFAFDLMGPDGYQLSMPLAPHLASHQTAGEMVEVYWHALLRDVPFSDYNDHPDVERATQELSGLSMFFGPKRNGQVRSNTLFRGNTPGDLAGPYISQFMFYDVPHGAQRIEQRNQTTVANLNHMVSYDNWLAVQNGNQPESNVYQNQRRYISNGRDLGEYVHQDYPGQAFFNAALILMNQGADFDANNPYWDSQTQEGFVTFNITQVLKLVAGVVSCALKHAWFHKWLVNRRARPEAFGGLVHNHQSGSLVSVVSNDILFSEAANEAFKQNGTYLLPMAYAEGSPTHPAYPAGHAAISGACATVLKAVFDEGAVLRNPVVASRNGDRLVDYRGNDTLTVGGELNKLAANISLGRDFAGVHYRSDGIQGLMLGEAVAIGVLAELRLTYHEIFEGFTLTKFNGDQITV